MDELAGSLARLAGKWAAFASFGTFALYLIGYLALRFQLSTYGVLPTNDLDVWDERYLFAGSRFLVYLVSSIPNVLLIVTVFLGIAYVPYKLLPDAITKLTARRVGQWAGRPARLAVLGILLAIGLIQFVMRQCFVLENLLLADKLPKWWISRVLLAQESNRALYFSGLVGGVLLTGVLLLLARRTESASSFGSKVSTGILAFLVAVEFLLLPINYSILIASSELPQVNELGGGDKLPQGELAWLVWEGKGEMTYLVRRGDGKRTMITMPVKDPRLEIVAYDAIFPTLFGQ